MNDTVIKKSKVLFETRMNDTVIKKSKVLFETRMSDTVLSGLHFYQQVCI